MELLRGLNGLRFKQRPCVATIGAFDGIHRGHQAVIAQLREQGLEHGLETAVVTFEPLPREYLAKGEAPARLQSFREKLSALAELKVDRLLCLRFNDALRRMSAEDFAREVFRTQLDAKVVVLGDDFRFGHDREGDANFMRQFGQREGFVTLPTATVICDDERVSSSRLREALAEGDFALVKRLLGRDFTLSGRVVYGKQLARAMGSPTANIALRRRSVPLHGVYAVTVEGGGLSGAQAVANVGTRPTVDDGDRPNLEVHVLDGEHSLYGERLRVAFHAKLRDEQRFASLTALKERIHEDKSVARGWFAAHAEDQQTV